MRCGVVFGKLQTLLIDVHRNNAIGAETFGYRHGEQADGTGTENENILTCAHPADRSHRMNRDGQRLHHRTVYHIDGIRQLVHQVSGTDQRHISADRATQNDSQLVVAL